jgi:hypothetical protein
MTFYIFMEWWNFRIAAFTFSVDVDDTILLILDKIEDLVLLSNSSKIFIYLTLFFHKSKYPFSFSYWVLNKLFNIFFLSSTSFLLEIRWPKFAFTISSKDIKLVIAYLFFYYDLACWDKLFHRLKILWTYPIFYFKNI